MFACSVYTVYIYSMKKKLTKTEMKALSIAVMCCNRFPELYTLEYIEKLKKDYAEKSIIWKQQKTKIK